MIKSSSNHGCWKNGIYSFFHLSYHRRPLLHRNPLHPPEAVPYSMFSSLFLPGVKPLYSLVLCSARFRYFKLLSHHQLFIPLVCSFKKIEKIYTFYKQSYIESDKRKNFLSYSYRKRKAVCVSHTIHIFISKCVIKNTRFAERRKIGKEKKNDFHVYKPWCSTWNDYKGRSVSLLRLSQIWWW